MRNAFSLGLLLTGIALISAPALAQDEDPHHGKFTLEEATKDLSGSGPLMATIETSKGTITCELFAEKTPITVANFVGLSRGLRAWRNPNTGAWEKGKPYYDGLTFHRVISGFMIQGGDGAGTGTGVGTAGPSKKTPGYQFVNETAPGLAFDKKGQLAMANAGLNTNGSQFFITDAVVPLGAESYTIFGQCDAPGVVSAIATTPKGARDKPLTEMVMKKVTIAYKKPGKPAKAPKAAAKK